MFVKAVKDRQEEDLKRFYMPTNTDFGMDRPEDYGTLTYIDDQGVTMTKKSFQKKVPMLKCTKLFMIVFAWGNLNL